MASMSDIRTQIAAILATVEGMGMVHSYERWANSWKVFLEHFQCPDGKVNGWAITRKSTPAERSTMPTIHRHHIMVLKGIYVLNDAGATAIVFDDQIEAIQNAFDTPAGYKLNDTPGIINSGPMQVRIVENRIFGDTLCHYGELEYPVIERRTYGA